MSYTVHQFGELIELSLSQYLQQPLPGDEDIVQSLKPHICAEAASSGAPNSMHRMCTEFITSALCRDSASWR